jgi:hypothetical protein
MVTKMGAMSKSPCKKYETTFPKPDLNQTRVRPISIYYGSKIKSSPTHIVCGMIG